MAKKRKAKYYDYADELLPCPFCGSKNLLWTGKRNPAIRAMPFTSIDCWGCFGHGPEVNNFKNGRGNFLKCKKLWNTRPTVNRLVKQGETK